MEFCEKIEQEITPSIVDLGYDIVRVSLQGNDVKTLQVMAERQDGIDMTVDDCETISRTVSALLDVIDPIAGRYVLEVSSPGLDRPLVRASDYARFKGDEAKIELVHDINGRKRFKGEILGLTDDNQVRLMCEGEEVRFPFSDIFKAKLILTDALIKKHQSQHL